MYKLVCKLVIRYHIIVSVKFIALLAIINKEKNIHQQYQQQPFLNFMCAQFQPLFFLLMGGNNY
jgi:hypothetical protein